MKGLVLAGGTAMRLRPLTHSCAKQLLPVANRPIVFYVLESLVEAGITDIVVVISHETGAEVCEAVGDGARFGATVSYVVQDRPGGLAHAVLSAEAALGGEPFTLYLGDSLLGEPVGGLVRAFLEKPEVAALVLLKEVANPSSFGVADVDAQGRVVRLVEKPSAPSSHLALVGVYLFRSVLFEAIARIRPSARGELEITDALAELLALGRSVHSHRVSSFWHDTGTKNDLLLANCALLDARLAHDVQGALDPDSRVEGRVQMGAGTTLVRSRVRGPAALGRDVRLVDACIGPYVCLGDGSVVERSAIEHSILRAAARVLDVPALAHSVLGRRAVVSGPPSSPHSTRGGEGGSTPPPSVARVAPVTLLAGDDARIDLGRG